MNNSIYNKYNNNKDNKKVISKDKTLNNHL